MSWLLAVTIDEEVDVLSDHVLLRKADSVFPVDLAELRVLLDLLKSLVAALHSCIDEVHTLTVTPREVSSEEAGMAKPTTDIEEARLSSEV